MKTSTTPTITKMVVTNPTTAWKMFETFLANRGNVQPVYVGKKQYFTVRQVADWYLKNQNVQINTGWFGRSLNSYAGKSLDISTIQNENGNNVRVYRRSK